MPRIEEAAIDADYCAETLATFHAIEAGYMPLTVEYQAFVRGYQDRHRSTLIELAHDMISRDLDPFKSCPPAAQTR